MAFSLYKTSRFARVYQDREHGIPATGIMKATINPMHYESVLDSGDYDTAIDLEWVATDDASLDGYAMDKASYQFELQTDVLSGSQKPQGTVTYKGRRGANEFTFKALELAYLYEPTRAVTTIGSGFDYTAGAGSLRLLSETRDLGSHADVDSEVINVIGSVNWDDLETFDTDEVQAEYCTRQEQVNFLGLVPSACVAWILANEPHGTTTEDTQAGFLFEVDFSDIPKVYLYDGTLVDPATDDFTDALGGIYLRDDDDNLIGIIETSKEGSFGFPNQGQTFYKRFWEDGGTNYCFVGIEIANFTATGTADYWEFRIKQYEDANGENDCSPSATKNFTPLGYAQTGNYYGTEYSLGVRLFPEVPSGASIVEGSEYANLTLYEHNYRDRYYTAVYPPLILDTFVDLASFDSFTDDFDDGPNGENWQDSYTFGTTTISSVGSEGGPVGPLDMSYPMEEFLKINTAGDGNAMRVAVRTNASNGYGYWTRLSQYENHFGRAAVLDVQFTYPAQRKPGFKDGTGKKNTRESRFYSPNMPYRLGVDDDPYVTTQDNKNRNRFS